MAIQGGEDCGGQNKRAGAEPRGCRWVACLAAMAGHERVGHQQQRHGRVKSDPPRKGNTGKHRWMLTKAAGLAEQVSERLNLHQ